MEVYIQLLIYLAAPAIIGLVTWVYHQQRALQELRLHISENYIKKGDIEEMKKDLKALTRMMYRVSGKLGIAVAEDE